MEYEGDDDANCNWRARYSHQKFGTGTRGLGNKRTTALLKLTRVLGRLPEIEETCSHPSGKQPANAGVKKSQMSKIIIITIMHQSESVPGNQSQIKS